MEPAARPAYETTRAVLCRDIQELAARSPGHATARAALARLEPPHGSVDEARKATACLDGMHAMRTLQAQAALISALPIASVPSEAGLQGRHHYCCYTAEHSSSRFAIPRRHALHILKSKDLCLFRPLPRRAALTLYR